MKLSDTFNPTVVTLSLAIPENEKTFKTLLKQIFDYVQAFETQGKPGILKTESVELYPYLHESGEWGIVYVDKMGGNGTLLYSPIEDKECYMATEVKKLKTALKVIWKKRLELEKLIYGNDFCFEEVTAKVNQFFRLNDF